MTLKENIEAATRRFESTLNVENRLSVTMRSVRKEMQYIYFFKENLDGLSNDEQAILAAEINAGRKRINAMGGIDIVPEKTAFQVADDEFRKDMEKRSQIEDESEKETQEKADQKKIEKVAQSEDDMGKAADDYFSEVANDTLGIPSPKKRIAVQEQEQESSLVMHQKNAERAERSEDDMGKAADDYFSEVANDTLGIPSPKKRIAVQEQEQESSSTMEL